MDRRKIVFGVMPLLLSSVLTALPAAGLTPEQWRADLDRLVEHLETNHRNPYHSVSAAELDAAIAALEADLPRLSQSSTILRMARLVASVGDGHTRLTLPVRTDHLGYRLGHRADPEPAATVPRFGTLPVRLRLLEGGVHIVAATPRHTALLGARVERIGRFEATAALEAVRPWAFGDTESGRVHAAAIHLGVPALLVEAGVSDDPDRTPVALRHVDGALEEIELPTLPYDSEVAWHAMHPDPAPLWLRRTDAYFWIEPLAEEDAVYVQINQIADDPSGETFGMFGRRLAQAIAEHRPRKVILDLRHNHGGDGSLSRALVLPLVRWEESGLYGQLYTLVGPETFSAAVILLDRLEQWTQNILVGEGPGGGPTSYGDADRETLPNSRLVARVSTVYRIGWTGGEQRTEYEIDLPAQQTATALLAGRDIVLEIALRHRAGDDLASRMIAAYDAGGINSSLFVMFRGRTDPQTAHLSTEEPMNRLARHVLEAGEARFAAAVSVFNWESYPDSVAAYRGEAEARLVMGELAAARAAIDKALARAPDDAENRAVATRIEVLEAEADTDQEAPIDG